MAVEPKRKDDLLKELSFLRALAKVSSSKDGMLVLDYILTECGLKKDPFDKAKNSGEMANLLGKQSVGRALIGKMIEADVSVKGDLFSQKNSSRINEINIEIQKLQEDN